MPDTRITGLAVGSSMDTADYFVYVDVSDTSMAPTGTTKKILRDSATSSISVTTSQISDLSSWAGSTSITTLGTVASGVWSGTAITATKGGTGLTALPTANQILGVNAGATAYEGKTVTAGTGISVSHSTGAVTISTTGAGSGTVTSVDMTVPAWLAVSGNPITSSGTLALTSASGQTANLVLATPNGSTGLLSPRALVSADIPTLAASKITTPGSSGQLIYNNASAWGGAADWTIGSSGQLTGAAISAPGSPTNGDLWLDSTQKVFSIGKAGGTSRLGGIIYSATDCTAVGNVSSGDLFANGTVVGSRTLDGTKLAAGMVLEIDFAGKHSSTASAPTMKFLLTLGGTTIGQSGLQSITDATTNLIMSTWNRPLRVYFRTINGAASKVLVTGTIFLVGVNANQSAHLTAGGGSIGTEGYSEVTVDLSGTPQVGLTLQWGTANASNTAQVQNVTFNLLG